ncbi:hypothetical protein HDR63_03960 [bacterium]|nr:hypothetical protein [bacterium]
MRNVFIFLFILVTTAAYPKHKLLERDYVAQYCTGGTEFTLPDRTRVDCLTDEYAIEFDFAPKWAEALGQSLHYARMTGREPGIYLILESGKDMRFVDILSPLCDLYGVKLELIQNY